MSAAAIWLIPSPGFECVREIWCAVYAGIQFDLNACVSDGVRFMHSYTVRFVCVSVDYTSDILLCVTVNCVRLVA